MFLKVLMSRRRRRNSMFPTFRSRLKSRATVLTVKIIQVRRLKTSSNLVELNVFFKCHVTTGFQVNILEVMLLSSAINRKMISTAKDSSFIHIFFIPNM